MSQLIKKENITIITGTYNDTQGNEKKRYKTIAELITMRGDDGNEYQFGEMWGPHGATKFYVYSQDENNQGQNNKQQQNQSNNQGGGFQNQQQGGFQNQNQNNQSQNATGSHPQQGGYQQQR